jgi:HEAT repeat protein
VRPTVICIALLAVSCSDAADDDIRAHVTIAVHHEGKEAQAAADYLAKYGRRAIPTIEAAMHTASPDGRKNLILALRRIADPEAVPLLAHLAQFDPAPDVRREASWTLRKWAQGPANQPLAEKSRAAVRALDEAKAAEESG